MTSSKTHYCKFCGATLDADYRCWDADCKFVGIIQVAKHESKLAREEAAALRKTDSHTQTLESPALAAASIQLTPHAIAGLSAAAKQELTASEAESQRIVDEKAFRWAKVGQLSETATLVQRQPEPEELKLQKLKLGPESQAYVVLNLNRAPTDHERVSLELMIRLFLKGYANAR